MWFFVVGALAVARPECETPWHRALPESLARALAEGSPERREQALNWLREDPDDADRWVALARAGGRAAERVWALREAQDRNPEHVMAQIEAADQVWREGRSSEARTTLEQLASHEGYSFEASFRVALVDRDSEALKTLFDRCPGRSDVALAWADRVPSEEAKDGLEQSGNVQAAVVRRQVELAVMTETVQPEAALEALTASDAATQRLRGWVLCLNAGTVTARDVASFWAQRRAKAVGNVPEGNVLPSLNCPVARQRPKAEPWDDEPFVRPFIEGVDSDIPEIVVIAEGPDALRDKVRAKLEELGYQKGRRKGDRVVYPADGLARPKVVLYDDGAFKIEAVTVVPPKPENPQMSIASPRQRRDSRAQMMEELGGELRAWRTAVFDQATIEQLPQRLGRRLDQIWKQGDGPEGPLLAWSQRRRALLDLWGSRACDGLGVRARQIIEAYFDLVVMASDHPFTSHEVAAVDSACQGRLVVAGAE